MALAATGCDPAPTRGPTPIASRPASSASRPASGPAAAIDPASLEVNRKPPLLFQARPKSADVVRVGAWNIEWLGSPENRSGPAREFAQFPEVLADYVLSAGVDVLGLAEIAATNEEPPLRSAILDRVFEIVKEKGGGTWEHELFPARTGRNQNLGIAWDATRVQRIGAARVVCAPDERGETGEIYLSRTPHAVTFRAGDAQTDFVVVPVHLKSNRGGDFATHRAKEAEFLLTALPAAAVDPDVIIIGDFNCSNAREPAPAALAGAGFVDLNASDASTHWRYGALDRGFVPAAQPEFARREFEVVREEYLSARQMDAEAFKKHLSDHFMVVTQVQVGPDDD